MSNSARPRASTSLAALFASGFLIQPSFAQSVADTTLATAQPAAQVIATGATPASEAAKVTAAGTPIEEIVVEGLRGTPLKHLDVSVTIVSRDDVVHSPQNSIEEILQRVPGVIMPLLPANELHPTGDPIELRGFGTTPGRTLVMVDGVPFNDPFFRYLDWQKIPKESIDRVEVIRGGGATTLWGNMAMAGVINIVTREPQPDELRGSLGYGSFNTFRADAAATIYSDEHLRVGINYGHDQTDGFDKVPKSENSPIFGNTSSQSDDGTVSAYLTPAEGDKLYLKLGAHYMREFGLQEAIAGNSWGTYEVRTGGTAKLPDESSIDVNLFYDKWRYSTQNAKDWCYNIVPAATSASNHCPGNVASPANASDYLAQLEDAPYTGSGGSVTWKPDVSGTSFSDVMLGTDGRLISVSDGSSLVYEANAIAPKIGLPFVLNKGQNEFEGVFAQGTYHGTTVPADVTLGLREDFWQLTGGHIAGSTLPDRSYSHFDPRLGLKYHLTDDLALRGAVYESFAAPGMNQTFRTYVSSTTLNLGNGALVPETNLGGEFGFVYDDNALSVEANGFYNTLDKFITSGKLCSSAATCKPLVPTLAPVFASFAQIAGTGLSGISQNFNAGNAMIAGAEILANWRFNDQLSLRASWTRTAAEMTSNALLAAVLGGTAAANGVIPTHKQIGGIPDWTALAGIDWLPISRLRISLTMDAFPGYWTSTYHNGAGLDSAGAIFDVGLSYGVSNGIEFFLNAQNIGNRTFLTSATNYGAYTVGAGPSNIGTPFNVFGGVRFSL